MRPSFSSKDNLALKGYSTISEDTSSDTVLRQHLLITVKLLIKRCLLVLVQLGIHDPSFLIGRVASKRLFVNQLENRMFLLKKATHIIQNKSTLLRHAFVMSIP